MVPIKNVTVSAMPVVQKVLADRTLANPSLAEGLSFTGYLEHLTPGEAYQEFAVELRNPALLQIDVDEWVVRAEGLEITSPELALMLADAQVIVVTQLLGSGSYVGNAYAVAGRPTPYDEGLPADHVMLVLDQKMQPL